MRGSIGRFELLCNDVLPRAKQNASIDYQLIASLDYIIALLVALAGFLRLGSVIKLVFGGEMKYLFCRRHGSPYD